jgi:hypothetical protein
MVFAGRRKILDQSENENSSINFAFLKMRQRREFVQQCSGKLSPWPAVLPRFPGLISLRCPRFRVVEQNSRKAMP